MLAAESLEVERRQARPLRVGQLHQGVEHQDANATVPAAQREEPLEVADLFGAFDSRPDSGAPASTTVMRSQASMRFEEPDDEAVDDPPEFLAKASIARSMRAPPPSSEPRWTTIQIREDLELRLASDDPERVAWLARIARRLRALLDAEAEP